MFFYSEPEPVTGDSWNLQLKQTWEPNDVDHLATGDLVRKKATGGSTYTVVDHSSISSGPITFAGQKCAYLRTGHSAGYTNRFFWNRPDVVSTPDTMAVSLRVLIYDIYVHGGVNLRIRGINTNTSGGGGYFFGQTSGGVLHGTAGNSLGPAVFDTWQRLRLDLIPQVQNGVVTGDLIRGYTAAATASEPNWELKMETLVTSRIPGSSSTNGYHQIEYSDYSPILGGDKQFYMDDFEIYTSTDLENL